MSEDLMTVYYYTDQKDKNAILMSLYVQPCESGQFGQGFRLGNVCVAFAATKRISGLDHSLLDRVYLTSTAPSEYIKAVTEGKADFVFKLELPKSHLKIAASGSPDIWIHKGPIYLRDYKFTVMKID